MATRYFFQYQLEIAKSVDTAPEQLVRPLLDDLNYAFRYIERAREYVPLLKEYTDLVLNFCSKDKEQLEKAKEYLKMACMLSDHEQNRRDVELIENTLGRVDEQLAEIEVNEASGSTYCRLM